MQEVYVNFLHYAVWLWTFDTVPYQLDKKDGKGTKYVDGRDNSGLH